MASKNASMTDGQAVSALIWPIRAAAWTALLLAVFWVYGVVALAGVALWRQHDPVWAMQELAQQEIVHSAQLSTPVLDPTSLSIEFGDAVRSGVIGLMTKGMRSLLNLPSHLPGRTASPEDDPDPGKTFFDRWWANNGDIVETCLWANYVLAIRALALLTGAIPMLALAYAVGLTDGASARAIRRADAGRESANLYHRFKIAQLQIIAVTFMAYLAWPTAGVRVEWVIVAMVLLCAICARMQLTYYKKYA